jgi:hypothetical protein
VLVRPTKERTVVREGWTEFDSAGFPVAEVHHEQKFDHPTQKPVELMRRPILNHTKRATWFTIRSSGAEQRSPPLI